MSDGIPNYLPGMEPENIQNLLNSLFDEIDAQFPDRIIVWSEWNHARWDKSAAYLTKTLGYQKGGDFLQAYGYKIVSSREDERIEKKLAKNKNEIKKREKKIQVPTVIVSIIALILAVAVVYMLIDRHRNSSNSGLSSTQSITISQEGTSADIPNSIPEYNAEDHVNDYEKYAVLSFEEVEGSKELAYGNTYSVDYRVRNNSNWTFIHTSFKMSFYDKEGTIIHTDNRTIDFGFESNQSAIVKFYCDGEYEKCKVVSYTYYFPRNNDILSGDQNVVDVDIISKNVRFMVSSLG